MTVAPTIRTISPDEVQEYARAFAAMFGGEPDEHDLRRVSLVTEPDRTFVGVTGVGEVVATTGVYSFEMALPGGSSVGCAGVTRVSVRTDHRRRGMLTRLMGAVHDQARERGDLVAALWASEAPIYGRYGYGPAVPTVGVEVRRAHAGLTRPGPVGDVELVDAATARRLVPAIRDQVRSQRPGLLSRSSAWWETLLDDDPRGPRAGASPRFHAIVPRRGYALYRYRLTWDDGVPDGEVVVAELHAVDAEAAAALWGFVTDIDLTERIRAGRRPPDDPLLARLADPARARVGHEWPLYLRVLDVPGVLVARGYEGSDVLTIEVVDERIAANNGRFVLAVEQGVATCERTDGLPDLTLDVRELATVLLGGVRASALHAAGRVVEHSARAAFRFDRLLHTPLAPWHDGMF